MIGIAEQPEVQEADLRSPYPWFGGKSRVASMVWKRFGEVRNYVEPFFGSGAMLLGRPQPFTGTETVNDLNAWLTNFWRALQAEPDEVARYADWPVSELDLHARGDWLFYGPKSVEFVESLRGDPDYYDCKFAGWWVWGQCSWIGNNWGRMECRSLPHLGAGMGVHRKLPHLGNAGMGVHRQLPHLGDAGRGETTSTAALLEYLGGLAERVRRVRVCCGDWSRVCGETPTLKMGLTAVFLDPPYSVEDRSDVYGGEEDYSVAHDVREWCKDVGDNPMMRLALCGYDGEHNELESLGWEAVAWKASGGYSSQGSRAKVNCNRERIWFSPHCLKPRRERGLFDDHA